jgi:prenyltransferase beta subunit
VQLRTSRGLTALLGATLLTAASVVAISSGPAGAEPITDCTASSGAVLAVDFSHFGGTVERGCDAHPSTGYNLLHDAGFTTTGTQQDGPAFICRIGNSDFNTGTQYPLPADEPCTATPPSTAHWSYWIAPAGQHSWTYSTLGARADAPAAGEVDAWVFGGTDSTNTAGGPSFTPDSVRAGGTATSSSAPSSTAPVPTGTPLDTHTHTVQTEPFSPLSSSTAPSRRAAPAAKTVDLAKGSSYLVSPANLLGGQYYEAFAGSGFADFGLTMDGAFALASTGKNDAALAKIVSFIATGKDGSGRSINDWTSVGTPFASGGSLGKEALLAEVAGYDPTDFNGQNLITALDSTVCAAATTSLDTVCAGTGDYANSTSVFSQSLGVIAQLRAGDTTGAASPVSYLESLQKVNGAWPSQIPDGGDSDVDSTAIAVMALALVPGSEAAVTKGLSWLAAQQESDGGFPGAAGDSTNSAALAIQGLSLDRASYAVPISRALTFLADQQNADGGFNVASAGQHGSDIRASAQVVGGATGISFGTLTRDVHGTASAAAGAKYLVSQLVDGDHLVNSYGADYGLTADLAIALAAANSQDAALTKVVRYLSAHVADYADPAGTTSYPGPYSGAVAKLALIAEITGQKPTAFGGFNLLKTLTDHVCAAADTAGSCTAPGDFYQSYSTVSQSLAVLALARGGVTPPAAAVARLASLQCPDGGFSSLLIAAGATCTSDVDTTGYALQALLLVPSQQSAAATAQSYLLAGQQRDGGYVGAAGENSNSTALAIQALLAADRAGLAPNPALAAGTDAIAAGRKFLYPLQNSNGGFGINAASPGSDVRSTTQAVPALAGAALSALNDLLTITSGPGTAGSTSSAPTSGSSPSGGSSSTAVAGGSLAFTGGQPITLLELAILLLLAGGGAMLLGRRRPAAARRH